MSHVAYELSTQPECWERAAELAPAQRPVLPRPADRIAIVGCGTSYYMAQAAAVLREEAGQGETDAFPASEFPRHRRYDRVVALTRSGTTTEVLDLLAGLREAGVPTTAVIGDPETPVMTLADEAVVLDFADERSVVQTRFATTALTLLRAHLGLHTASVVADARAALAEPLPVGLDGHGQFTFLGRGWSVGLANEAALKMREASLSWAESYPAMEYRHGPISVSGPGTVTWSLDQGPHGQRLLVGGTRYQWVARARLPLA
ncbi:SIS domain-containing protein, partial [Streptomyces sp. NPDC059447]|uniref:SIS domain-containing protein n=1 Tax=Streptomyces sp. NPDC059447 TaxID=3346834 RepID=UPI0036AD33C0